METLKTLAVLIVLATFLVGCGDEAEAERLIATQAAINRETIEREQSVAIARESAKPTPFSIPTPIRCNPPTRSECRIITVQRGDTALDVCLRAYPGCHFEVEGCINLFVINGYSLEDAPDYPPVDNIPDFEINEGDSIIVVPMGNEFQGWNIETCKAL